MSDFLILGEITLSEDYLKELKFTKPRTFIDSTGNVNFRGMIIFDKKDGILKGVRYFSDFSFEDFPPEGTKILCKENPENGERFFVLKK